MQRLINDAYGRYKRWTINYQRYCDQQYKAKYPILILINFLDNSKLIFSRNFDIRKMFCLYQRDDILHFDEVG